MLFEFLRPRRLARARSRSRRERRAHLLVQRDRLVVLARCRRRHRSTQRTRTRKKVVSVQTSNPNFPPCLPSVALHFLPRSPLSILLRQAIGMERPSILGSMKLSPPVRTRLTNLAFYSVALISLCTVSLAMSGVGPATLPCPARSSPKLRNNDNSDWSLQHSDSSPPHRSGEGAGQGGAGSQEKRRNTPARTRKWLQDPITPHSYSSLPPAQPTTSRKAPPSTPGEITTSWIDFTTVRNYYRSIRGSGH